MLRLLCLLFLVSGLSYESVSQVACSDFVFNRWYHTMYHSMEIKDIAPTADGNFVVAGFQLDFYDTLRCWIAKFDMAGNMLWQNDLNKHKGESVVSALEELADGSFIVAGGAITHQNFSDTAAVGFLAKFDAQGLLIWERWYDEPTSYQETFYDLEIYPNGDILAVGSRETFFPSSHQDSDLWIMRSDPDGNTIWDKKIGDSNSDIGKHVLLLPAGDFWVNNRHIFNDANDSGSQYGWGNAVWLLHFDQSGELLQKVRFESDSAYICQKLAPASDGGFVAAGYTNSIAPSLSPKGKSDVWVVKFDAGGNIQWQMLYGGSSFDGAVDIDEIPDGTGYFVLGGSLSDDGDICRSIGLGDYWVIRLDTNGNITWEKNFGGSDPERPSCLMALPEGFIAAGWASSEDGDVGLTTLSHAPWVIRVNHLRYDRADTGPRDTTICLGALTLRVEPVDCAEQILWNTDENASQINVEAQGEYWAEIRSGSCFSRDTLRVHFIPCNGEPCLIFPNAFTPNGDEVNDIFRPIVLCGETAMQEISIYNRWGQLIYENNDPGNTGWAGVGADGRPLPSDVYAWRCVYQNVIDGEVISGVIKGGVTLIR